MSVIAFTVRRLAPVGMLIFFLQVPALKDIFKYLPYPVICSAVIFTVSAVLYYGLLYSAIGRPILQSKWYTAALLLLIGLAGAVVYPKANALGAVGGGSIADDAFIEPIKSLLHGHGLYDVDIGKPVSPGPGWILLNAPFAFRVSIYLLTPAYLSIAALVCRHYSGGYLNVNRMLTVLMSSLLFWDLSVTGYDHIAVGIAIMLMVVVVNRMKLTWKNVVFVALAGGIIATSRIIFLPLGLLLGALLLRRHLRFGLLFAGIGTGCTLLLHGFFFCTSKVYQPLHLFSKVNNDTGTLPIVITGVIALAIGIPLLFQRSTRWGSWAATVLCWIGIPLGFAAWGELDAFGYRLAAWEGAHYLLVLAPLVAAWLFLGNTEEKIRKTVL
jgi:hypothetical protein